MQEGFFFEAWKFEYLSKSLVYCSQAEDKRWPNLIMTREGKSYKKASDINQSNKIIVSIVHIQKPAFVKFYSKSNMTQKTQRLK